MINSRPSALQWIVIGGDLLALLLVTLVGFASHGEAIWDNPRLWTTFIPLTLGWMAVAPLLQVYHPETITHWRSLWRPAWAVVLAIPLAGFLRGIWLNTPIVPVFLAVLAGTTLLAILLWRTLFWVIWSWRGANG
jgi:hypothetical protein